MTDTQTDQHDCAHPACGCKVTGGNKYFSDYGKVFVNNAHIEGGNFLSATNPRQIVSRGWPWYSK
jgi:hypothetical protein